MNLKFCKCCGAAMEDTGELYGTNADGSKNDEYCKNCFENGEPTFKGPMEDIIEIWHPYIPEEPADTNKHKNIFKRLLLR